MRVATLALLVCLAGVARGDTQWPGESVDIARAHYATGLRYYDTQRFAEAAHEFVDAFRLSGRSELLFDVGRAYEHARDPLHALDAYRRYEQTVTETSVRDTLLETIAALTRQVGRLRVTCDQPGGVLTVDATIVGPVGWRPWIELNPGRHRVVITKEGYGTGSATVEIAASKETTIAVPLHAFGEAQPSKSPLSRRWWLWTAVGVVVAGGVVAGAVLGSRSSVPELSTHVLPAR